ncbi:hypothetical protein PspLS_02380 [Pyricularia sp. CBS 133598]|nr:hypothetical protein PspLS_02380 [Pyricularia sp. CBS 133598]
MADSAASEPPTEQVANLILDEVTGEKVSKTELKRRQKARQKADEKAKKAAAAPPKPAAAKKAAKPDEQELNPNQYFEIRSREVNGMLENPSGPNPYPHKFLVDYDASQFEQDFKHLKSGDVDQTREIRIAGRIFTKRSSGNKLIFYDIKTGSDTTTTGSKMQIMCQAQYVKEGGPTFEQQHEHLGRGDVIGIVGFPGRTAPKAKLERGEEGELSLFATEVVQLSPSLHLLPGERAGFTDGEKRFRMRYLDFMFNDKSREVLWQRSRIVKYIRDFFHDRKFIEVETPMMTAIAGGATALPFVTHHNEYDLDMFMRIAPELYLKMLVVGGYNKVFEIGKNFRNEGCDLTHNPEFTTIEAYAAYYDMYDVMDYTEELVSGLVKHLTGGYETKFTTQSGETYEVNWARPWKRVKIMPELEKLTGKKFPPYSELHTDETNQFLRDLLKEKNIECTPPLTNARMLDKLIGEYLEETCINPTFLMEHPQLMSPLAKYHRTEKGISERFEGFVCKKEICNAYTELNNPFDQRLRFEEQARQKAQGDDEAQMIDENFLRSLEYGLPPTAGWGLGIDRLCMFLTNNATIREVLAFPFMRDEKSGPPVAAEVTNVEPVPVEGIAHK